IEKSPPIPSLAISAIAVVIVALGVGLAYLLYGRQSIPREAPQDVSPFTHAARAEVYGDLINEELIVRPGTVLIDGLLVFDGAIVDGGATGPSTGLRAISRAVGRRLQNGYARSYALYVLFGAAVVLFALTAVNWS
ncbi:MAG: NADH-quinone oxidoreductase subunit L, partial [Marmoricola sp.]